MTRKQLLALGAGEDAIDSRLRTGRLIRVYPGVYAVGHRQPGPRPRAAAAVLACGESAALSHGSAAALWGIGRWPAHHEVIAPYQRRHRGIRTHRTRTLTSDDVTVHWGIPVTTPVRTICDIASRLSDDQLMTAIDDARHAGYLGPTDLRDDLLRRCPRARRLIDPDSGPSRSQLERAWRRFAARYRLPPYVMNVRVAGYEVDVLFAAQRLVVELDGWRFHRGHRNFESERLRDTVLKDHRIDTVRLTARRLNEPEAARLHRILDNQGRS